MRSRRRERKRSSKVGVLETRFYSRSGLAKRGGKRRRTTKNDDDVVLTRLASYVRDG